MVARRALEVRAAKAAEGLEGDALAEAIGAEVGVSGDRLARLLELVDVAGEKLGNVRLVRVFQGETAPPQAMSVGEFHYVLDRMAAPPRADRGDRDDRRGGRGGREGGPRRDRPGGPGRGGPGGARGRDGFGADRGERVNPREVPVAGAGWLMTRAPRDPDEDRRGPRRGPRRDRPPGERRDRPGGDRRGPRRGGPPRPPQQAAGPAADAPPHLGPKEEVRVGDAPGGDPRRRRRRGGRRRGGGGPRPEGTSPPPAAQTAPAEEGARPIVPPPPPEPEPDADEPAGDIKESEG